MRSDWLVVSLTVSLINEDGMEITAEVEKIGVKDEAGMLEPGRVEFTPCDSTLGDKVTEIEGTGMDLDEEINTEESSWLTEGNKTVRAIMGEVVFNDTILVTGIPNRLVKPVESVSEFDNTTTAVADDIVLLGLMNSEGVSLIILGTVLRRTETVEDDSSEEVADTEVKISDVIKLALTLSKEIDEDMVTGKVNEASLRGKGIDDNCPVAEDTGGKIVVSDWSYVMGPDEDMIVTVFPWIL